MKFKIMCICGKEADIMSAVKKKQTINQKEVELVEITFICPYCGNGDVSTHYLYNEDETK